MTVKNVFRKIQPLQHSSSFHVSSTTSDTITTASEATQQLMSYLSPASNAAMNQAANMAAYISKSYATQPAFTGFGAPPAANFISPISYPLDCHAGTLGWNGPPPPRFVLSGF